MKNLAAAFLLALTAAFAGAQQLTPYTLALPAGKQITLQLPQGFTAEVAMTGLHRPRFLRARLTAESF